MKSFLSRYLADESGSTAIEYGLIAALVSVVLVGAMSTLSGKISDVFTQIATAIPED
ncbi:Flp family type IVb pilin [Phenylobacterium sp.]|uniref:Flp family type IVb pilin n=1 Tax=Phenylobacterium sp. TaxID=1871053 RepID=UPI00286AF364|nr:Flp family type IVb pilin [Phenylobacterium sp.]